MTTVDPFRTKAGRLTPWAFACGYLEQVDRDGRRITLWAEGDCYHVRAHDFDTHTRLFWRSYERLTEARADFDRSLRALATLEPEAATD